MATNSAACGDLITVRLADHKRGWGKFCGKSCSAAYKSGQRPRDVNAVHAKSSEWAREKLHRLSRHADGKAPVAQPIRVQVGRVRVTPKYHSPSACRECGTAINGPGLCYRCDDHRLAMDAAESGWDGHKN
jgi:hypothetical protein